MSGVPEDQLLVSLYPGLPTTAELFILPDERISSEQKRSGEEALEMVRTMKSTNIALFIMQTFIKKLSHVY